MAVNKVVFGNETLIDISDSTVNANNLLSGEKAYGANGIAVTGAVTVPEELSDLSDVSVTNPTSGQLLSYNGTTSKFENVSRIDFGRISGTTVGSYSSAEGFNNTASGDYSHAEGFFSTASGSYSHAEGSNNTASGLYSHAEGNSNTASGNSSHAEGTLTHAYGVSSHAEGGRTNAYNEYEHAEGYLNVSHHVEDSNFGDAGNTIHSVGIGTASESSRKNAFEIMQNGDTYLIGVGDYDGSDISSATPLQEVITSGGGGITLLDVYPIGSIYMSINNVSPQILFGGIWEAIEDRFLLSASSNHSAGSTGGSENATLVSHNHTFTGTAQDHLHGMVHKHYHNHTHAAPVHNHSVGAHTHGLNNHTHSFTTGGQSANHTHGVANGAFVTANANVGKNQLKQGSSTTTNYFLNVASSTTVSRSTATNNQSADHTHSGTTGGNNGNTTNSAVFNTGNGGGDDTGYPSDIWTSDTYDVYNEMKKTDTDRTLLTPSGTISTNGNSAIGANMPPYLAVYMWKRVS